MPWRLYPKIFQICGTWRVKETRSLILIIWRVIAFLGINDILVNLKASRNPPAAVLADWVNVLANSTHSTTAHFQPYLLPGFHNSYLLAREYREVPHDASRWMLPVA